MTIFVVGSIASGGNDQGTSQQPPPQAQVAPPPQRQAIAPPNPNASPRAIPPQQPINVSPETRKRVDNVFGRSQSPQASVETQARRFFATPEAGETKPLRVGYMGNNIHGLGPTFAGSNGKAKFLKICNFSNSGPSYVAEAISFRNPKTGAMQEHTRGWYGLSTGQCVVLRTHEGRSRVAFTAMSSKRDSFIAGTARACVDTNRPFSSTHALSNGNDCPAGMKQVSFMRVEIPAGRNAERISIRDSGKN
ncbi:MAG: DUF1036 domain-containing protein [Sphingomonadaceae bacterium]|nr:DUF1036 domain-containing protein [Sphingomonadaceae bacterium]MCP5390285.1 DUF1036 domain-containing protein [Sphingomonadaceae bacterium]MCP5392383.1 DUF1036 domain-containing protein [Sphingomonadaceae bacterium]